MNKIIYLSVAVVVIVGAIFVLQGNEEEVQEIGSNDFVEEAELLGSQEDDPDTKATDYNSSRSNRTTAAAVDMDTDDEGDNAVDNDCDDPNGDTSACAPGDPVPGIGITEEQSGGVSRLDSDDDGDSVPTDDSGSAEMQSGGYIKIDDVKGESSTD